MQRRPLDFDFRPGIGALYLRMVADEPCFHVIDRQTRQRSRATSITLNIDFMRAEIYPDDVGLHGRGLGYVEFGAGGPQIVSRTKLNTMGGCYGFVFDVASPYPGNDWPKGIRSHVLGSTLLAALQAMDEAYKLYSDHLAMRVSDLGGVPMPKDPAYCVPVYDVVGWKRLGGSDKGQFASEDGSYLPVFELVGMVNHIDHPLSARERDRFKDNHVPAEIAEPILGESPTRGGLPDEIGGRREDQAGIPNRAYGKRRPRLEA